MSKKGLLLFLLILFDFSGFSQVMDSMFIDKIALAEKEHSQLKSTYYESINYSDYDLIYQRMEWEIDPSVKYINGVVTSYFKSQINDMDTVEFDLNDQMTVDSILHHNHTVEFQQLNNKIIIPVNPSLQLSEVDSLSVFYQGIPEPDLTDGSFSIGKHADIPVLWTLSEPFGAMEWWPCKQSLSDKIDSIDIIVKTPEMYRTASNGVLVSDSVSEGYRTMHWKHRYPIATYLVAIAATNYAVYNDTLKFDDGRILKIENYVYPENLDLAKSQTSRTAEVMKIYNELIGEYPFANEKYGHAQFGWHGGMEHQTMSFMYNFGFDLVAHELAHQWFGDYITLGSWQDIWLNEGFATYMTGLAYENIVEMKLWGAWKSITLNKIVSQPGGSVFVKDTADFNTLFSSRLSYSKGAYILHMLRWILGDDNFFKGMQAYFNDAEIAGGFARNEQFIQHMEEAGDTSLTEFFNDWYYGEGYPIYSLKYGTVQNGKIWVELSQSTSHESVDFFEMPVPVRFYNSDKTDAVDFRLNNTQNNQQFLLDVNFKIGDVVIDPDMWLISKTDEILSIPSEQLKNSILIYPNPSPNSFYISILNNVYIRKVALYDLAGKLLKIFPENTNEINLSDLVSGVYIVNVKTDVREYTQKITKN